MADREADSAPQTRLYVSAGLAPDMRLALSEAQAHQLRVVRRLGDGATVALFNGRHGEWLAEIAFARRDATALVLGQRRLQAEEADLKLLFAPLKHARLDFLVEKATELGAGCLYPVMTARTQVARVNVERLRETAREAAEQCERLTVPPVAEPVALAAALTGWDNGRPLYFCAEAGEARPIAQALAEHGKAKAALLIGPEGGFTPDETAFIRSLAFAVPVSLGPRLLRAETAAVAALACWQAIAGEWAGGMRPRADLIGGV